ncbi:C-GCAxxG-C-C family protein [Dehalococcoides mccartyi]|jgi:C_GCAxxG_C_C family probable redox protein|nr:C-GCAxxG-C-C family protein [Dehalococcoides mccartyi]
MKSMSDIAVSAQILHEKGFNCAQSLLAAFAPSLGIETGTALKLASAFGGGMAARGDTCGVISGGLMVIGLKFGQASVEDKAAREKCNRLGREFLKQFEAEFGATACRDLIKCNIGTPEGAKLVKEKGLREGLCSKLVYRGAEILSALIEQI